MKKQLTEMGILFEEMELKFNHNGIDFTIAGIQEEDEFIFGFFRVTTSVIDGAYGIAIDNNVYDLTCLNDRGNINIIKTDNFEDFSEQFGEWLDLQVLIHNL